jgi:hypothetical protein
MKTQRLSITMPSHTLAQVEARQARPGEERSTDRSAVIAKSLDRYFYALSAARRGLRERFSAGEQGLLIDVLNGTLFASPCAIGFLEHEVAAGIVDGLAERWHVDGAALMKKLKALSYVEKLALIDAAERWLHRAGRGEQPHAGEMLD